MQDLASTNPDTRPLPKGWVQHYESSKQLWYYVQITVMPPKVSFTHPADLLSTAIPSPSISQPSRSPVPSEQTPSKSVPTQAQAPAQTQGMTLAQRLYASSGNSDAKPMIDHRSITNLSTAPEAPNSTTPRISSIPTPPPSTSPSIDDSRRPGRSVTPVGSFHLSPSAASIPRLSSVTSEPQIAGVSQLRGGSSMVQLPTRPQSTQPPAMLNSLHGKNHPFSNLSQESTAFGGRRTPHLITTARPPAKTRRSSMDLPQSPHISPPLNLNAESTPSSSLLFSPSTPISKPILPPLSTPPSSIKSPRKHGSPVSEVSTISTITPTNFHKYPHLSAAGNHMKGIYQLSGGLPRRPDPKKLMAALKIAFAKGGTGVSESDMQRVANADPHANYQAIINALKFQQQQNQQQTNPQFDLQSGVGLQSHQAPALTVNYQALIADLENLRIIGQAQAQQAADQARQAQEAHEKATEALSKQRAALMEQQAISQQQAQQAAASRVEQLQQQQHQAAAKLHSQQKQHRKMAAHQQQLVEQKLLQQEQANQAYHRQLEVWQEQGGKSPARMDSNARNPS